MFVCGLTFELSRPRRRTGLPVRPMMTKGGCAGKPDRRSGSALERGVRLHSTGSVDEPSCVWRQASAARTVRTEPSARGRGSSEWS